MLNLIVKYFPELTTIQKSQFSALKPIYDEWNRKINIISRKDMENFYLHHVLHSLAIARLIRFAAGTSVLDVGTGGGFPGMPLAILFPDSEFVLLDSIQKKINVVREIASSLGISNILSIRSRVEDHQGKYDFIVCRAVTAFPEFVRITRGRIKSRGFNKLKNGILYLKGGDLSEELHKYRSRVRIWNIEDFFPEPFFATKRIVYLPV
jgi:16S rRNA (guanine527-N7)-methyltransferase